MGTGGPFPGGKARPGRDADHSPHLVPRSWMSRSYTSSDYELDNRAIGVRSPAGAKDFSSNLCPDRLWGPPSLLYNGYRGPFPGGKARPERDTDHSPHLVPRSWMSRSYTSSDYELDNWPIGVRSPAGAKDFSCNLYVQTGSGAHPASCTMGTGSPFPGAKTRPERDSDHSPHLVPRSWMSRSYTSSDYELDNRAIGVRSPAGAKDFSSNLCVQTGSEAHPASCTMGTGVLFPGGKARPERDADHSPHLVPRSWMSRNYTSSPPKRLHGVYRDCFTLLYF
jgi:hypothetical protein